MPYFSASSDRLYYLAGDGDVRFLAPDGTAGLVKQLSVGNLQHASFAVSADDTRIAVAIIDYSAQPHSLRVYAENLRDTGGHEEILTSSTRFEWPVGWRGNDLVFAVGPASAQSGTTNPSGAYFGYRLADAHGNFIRELCGPTATSGPGMYGSAIGRIYPTGAACGTDGPESLALWSGGSKPLPTAACGPWRAVEFSPSLGLVLCADYRYNAPTETFHVMTATGQQIFSTTEPVGRGANAGYWWVDEGHVVIGNELVDVTSRSTVALSPGATFVWRVPGDLT